MEGELRANRARQVAIEGCLGWIKLLHFKEYYCRRQHILKGFKTAFWKKFGLKMLAEINNSGLKEL